MSQTFCMLRGSTKSLQSCQPPAQQGDYKCLSMQRGLLGHIQTLNALWPTFPYKNFIGDPELSRVNFLGSLSRTHPGSIDYSHRHMHICRM